MSLFLNSNFFWLVKYWGGAIAPPPLPPCSYGHVLVLNIVSRPTQLDQLENQLFSKDRDSNTGSRLSSKA